ncbi:PIR Superfamily Protein [Plasmodium ovale wallikeri]|uniref:PIR Superfamily Protein n=1 Tax=Plasmodium ovale wallikeri TaxID=864142 RepID=A0A1A8YNX1_PLAOA|nr:PIR Superfamily Protein [Plasmodium ovale wallikeri]SBT33567.1 PIR Superfamily Protein [Plasmodium ovale wallikeri]
MAGAVIKSYTRGQNLSDVQCVTLFDDITSKVSDLIDELELVRNVSTFADKCHELGQYIDNQKTNFQTCRKYASLRDSTNIEDAVSALLNSSNIQGRCSRNTMSKNKECIKIIQDIHEFCEKKTEYEASIQSLKRQYITKSKCDENETCKSKCSEYTKWMSERKNHFSEKKSEAKCSVSELYNKTHYNNCNVTNDASFQYTMDFCYFPNSQNISAEILPATVKLTTDGRDTHSSALSSEAKDNENADSHDTSQKYYLDVINPKGRTFKDDEDNSTIIVTLVLDPDVNPKYSVEQEHGVGSKQNTLNSEYSPNHGIPHSPEDVSSLKRDQLLEEPLPDNSLPTMSIPTPQLSSLPLSQDEENTPAQLEPEKINPTPNGIEPKILQRLVPCLEIKKKKERKKEMEWELKRMLYSSSPSEKNCIYLKYDSFEQALHEISHENTNI